MTDVVTPKYSRRPTRALRRSGALCLGLALAACQTRESGFITGTSGAGGLVPGASSTRDVSMVGEWSLILLNYDAGGALMSSSETRWRFDADGTVTRSSIGTSYITGFQDIVRTTGRWSTSAGNATIELTSPPSGTLVLSYRVDRSAAGDVLFLGSLRFARRS